MSYHCLQCYFSLDASALVHSDDLDSWGDLHAHCFFFCSQLAERLESCFSNVGSNYLITEASGTSDG